MLGLLFALFLIFNAILIFLYKNRIICILKQNKKWLCHFIYYSLYSLIPATPVSIAASATALATAFATLLSNAPGTI